MVNATKEKSVMVGTYLPTAVHAEVKRIAKGERRSIAAYLLVLIEKDLARRKKRAA